MLKVLAGKVRAQLGVAVGVLITQFNAALEMVTVDQAAAGLLDWVVG